MDRNNGNPGINKLANVLSRRIRAENESPLILDFGEIQEDGSLRTDTFPVPLPKGAYSVCRHVGGLSFEITGGHSHTVAPPAIKPGDRVLVAWVQAEAVVVDVIGQS